MGTIKVLVLITLLLFSGCTTYKVSSNNFEANLTVKCPETLPEVTGKNGKAVLNELAKEWSTTYHDCKTRHNSLVEAIESRKDQEIVKFFWE